MTGKEYLENKTYYKDLLIYSKTLLTVKNETRISAEDLVNESYLICFNKAEITKEKIKKIIIGVYYAEINKFNTSLSYTPLVGGDYVCTKCNQLKDVSCFRIRMKDNGYKFIESTCKICEQIPIKIWNKKNRDKRRVIENRALKKRILNLSDGYLVSLLKRQKIQVTQNSIELKRQKIIKHRNTAANTTKK